MKANVKDSIDWWIATLHLIHHFLRDTFAGQHQLTRIKRRCILVTGRTEEVLIIRFLRNLFHRLPVQELVPVMDEQGTEYHMQRFYNIASATRNRPAPFTSNTSQAISNGYQDSDAFLLAENQKRITESYLLVCTFRLHKNNWTLKNCKKYEGVI